MKDKLLIGGVALALVLPLLFGAYNGIDVGPKGDKGDTGNLGASPGPTHTNTQFFLQGFETGGRAGTQASSTVAASAVLAHRDMKDGITFMSLTPTVGAVTLTTEATTTFALGRAVGSSRTIHVYNATTTTGAASVITWAAGTGFDLQEDEGATITQNGLEVARLTFVRKADTDILMWVEAGQVGD